VLLVRGRRFHRAAHWAGIVIAVPLLVIAARAGLDGWHQTDLDDRNEYYGVALLLPVAAFAAYTVARAIGWFLVELFD